MRSASLIVLLATAGLAAAIGPQWYSCDPTTCAAPDCVCPSDSPPGGLTPAETPQFVLIQHSNALEEVAYGIMEELRGDLTNSNGCKIPMTWFAMSYHSNCSSAWSAQERNDEIAMQTNRYTPIYPFNAKTVPTDPNPRYNNSGSLLKEVEISRTWWNEACKIPIKDMNGYRSPELVHNPPVRKVLEDLGFLYDATINEYYATYSSTSPSKDEVLWPYTMDNGIPQDCNFTGVEVAFCNDQEKYKGLWEVPLYQMQDSVTSAFLGNADYGDDPTIGSYNIYNVLKDNFDTKYEGTRSPLTIALNVKWINDTSNAKDLKKFIEYAASKPDTWFITTQDLVHWMQNPVPLKEAGNFFTCTTFGERNGGASPLVIAPAPAPVEVVPEAEIGAVAPAPEEAILGLTGAPDMAPAAAPVVSRPAKRPAIQQPTTEEPTVGEPTPSEPTVDTQSTSGSVTASASAVTAAVAVMAALAVLL